jgi:DNA repair photolyase
MSLTKSVGNMYSWVTHMHTHLGGKCPHQCSYCYVGKSRYGIMPRYEGELRVIEKEFNVNYGTGKTIFIEHMNDLFADEVPHVFIHRILAHCKMYPDNTYVFQSKNPHRLVLWENEMPFKFIVGTTIETNREIPLSKAPSPLNRFKAMTELSTGIETFVTIEPIMQFDLNDFVDLLKAVHPTFINIGADSKKCSLPEPTSKEVQTLIKEMQRHGLNIKIKNNLERFLQ